MDEYLKTLKEVIDKKKIKRFCVFPDVSPFKIIKKNSTEMRKIIKANPEKYKGRFLISIGLDCYPNNFNNNKGIFDIHITVYRIHDDGLVDKYLGDSWLLYIKYLPEDLEKHPFKMKNVEIMMKLAYKRKVETPSNGIFYRDFEEDLAKLKERKIKNKRSVKRTKKNSKKSVKKSKKNSRKK